MAALVIDLPVTVSPQTERDRRLAIAAAHIEAAGGLASVWGQRDCATWAASYCRLVTGKDPAGKFRGRYEGPDEAWMLIAAAGGFVPLMRRQMRSCGFLETFEPDDGDVGVVAVPPDIVRRGPVCAIRFAGAWYVKAQMGVYASAGLPFLVAWRVE